MNAVALALILAAGQSADFYQDEVPAKPSRVQDVRFGTGGASILTVPGVGAAFEAGLELAPWGPVALRTTLGSAIKVGWGTFFVAPEAVFRLRPVTSRFSPYLAAGLNLALINITDQALGIDNIPTMRINQAAATGNDGAQRPREGEDTGVLGVAVQQSMGPQASLGVRFQAFRRIALDLGARYTYLRFDGKAYNELGFVLTVCAPG